MPIAVRCGRGVPRESTRWFSTVTRACQCGSTTVVALASAILSVATGARAQDAQPAEPGNSGEATEASEAPDAQGQSDSADQDKPEELEKIVVTGIRAVVAGRRYTSLPLTTDITQSRSRTNDPLLRAIESLTPTELRILKLLADYQTSKQIADELGVSIRTIETHRAHICQKLELKGSHALMKFAVKHKALL